ncbi:MAG: stage II sporulation protein P [Oscillospiraceae bacterium]|nr:stage II sporulation protein P [Oscillospiraceae bacterium]
MQEFSAKIHETQAGHPAGAPQPNARRSRLLAAACIAVAALTLCASQRLLQTAALLSARFDAPLWVSGLLPGGINNAAPAAAVTQSTAVAARAGGAAGGAATALTKDFDITATPADIRVLMEEAATEFAKQSRDGDIISKTYTKKDGTQSYGSIAVRNTTATRKVDIQKTLAEKINLKIDKSKPAVLLFHTHTTEGYEILDRPWYAANWSSRTENGAKSIVRVGDAVAQMLERAGFQVIHDTTIYDKQYGGAYDRSRVMVRRVLKENPSIRVTLDIHRDAIHQNDGGHVKPVNTINGKKAAQVMIITGTQEGSITDFPNWEQNLRFALQLQKRAESSYPGLMRPLFFCARKYNMNETPCSLLLEFGSDANTLDEAVYSGRLIGDSLAKLLEGYAAKT